MTPAPTILLAGGGSGGHLYPGIGVAQALKHVLPDLAPLFLCTQRPIDEAILRPSGYEFLPQPIVPPVRSAGGLIRFWTNWRATQEQVRQVLADRAPAAVLGLGGYAAGVAVKLAAKRGIPAAILNPDVIPGRANRYLMKFVRKVCCGFDATAEHVDDEQRPKLTTTGCPILADFRDLPGRRASKLALGLDPQLLTLVVTGASQGAQSVNEAVLEVLRQILAAGGKLQGWQVLHLAGKDHAPAVRDAYRELGAALPARVIDFTPGLAQVWASADLAVSRGGAGSCAELTACGVPSVLLPYPYHKDNHQRANAAVLADAGAAVLLEDQKAARPNAEVLRPTLETLLYNGDKRQQMAAAARTLARPDAADAVARVIAELTAANG